LGSCIGNEVLVVGAEWHGIDREGKKAAVEKDRSRTTSREEVAEGGMPFRSSGEAVPRRSRCPDITDHHGPRLLKNTQERRGKKALPVALSKRPEGARVNLLVNHTECPLRAKPKGRTGSLETAEWVSMIPL
jgi:hypothetical protein